MGDDDRRRRYPGDGGAERIRERPPDRPGPLRGPSFILVAILAFLSLAMPVAWGAGLLAGLRDVLGAGALTVLWIVWAMVVLVVIWTFVAMWRRAA